MCRQCVVSGHVMMNKTDAAFAHPVTMALEHLWMSLTVRNIFYILTQCMSVHTHTWKIVSLKENLPLYVMRFDILYFIAFSLGNILQNCSINIRTRILILLQFTDLIEISPVLPALIYACVFSSIQFITCVGSCIHHHNQDTEQFYYRKNPLCCP